MNLINEERWKKKLDKYLDDAGQISTLQTIRENFEELEKVLISFTGIPKNKLSDGGVYVFLCEELAESNIKITPDKLRTYMHMVRKEKGLNKKQLKSIETEPKLDLTKISDSDNEIISQVDLNELEYKLKTKNQSTMDLMRKNFDELEKVISIYARGAKNKKNEETAYEYIQRKLKQKGYVISTAYIGDCMAKIRKEKGISKIKKGRKE